MADGTDRGAAAAGARPGDTGGGPDHTEGGGWRIGGWLLVAAAVVLLPATAGVSLLALPVGAAVLVHANRRRETARDAAAMALRSAATHPRVAPPEPWTAAAADRWLRQVARPVDERGR